MDGGRNRGADRRARDAGGDAASPPIASTASASSCLTAGGSDESVHHLRRPRRCVPPPARTASPGIAGLASENEDIRTRVLPARRAIENALAGRYPNAITVIGPALVRRPPRLAAASNGRMKLFLDDAYARSAEATVSAAPRAGVVLDRSVFYARSGGQPGDTGRLTWPGGEAAVAEAIKGEGDTILLPARGRRHRRRAPP